MTDADRNALALGDDLSALGLDMKSKDRLIDTFGGPFTDKPASSEPNYNVSVRCCLQGGHFVMVCILQPRSPLHSPPSLSSHRYPCVIT